MVRVVLALSAALALLSPMAMAKDCPSGLTSSGSTASTTTLDTTAVATSSGSTAVAAEADTTTTTATSGSTASTGSSTTTATTTSGSSAYTSTAASAASNASGSSSNSTTTSYSGSAASFSDATISASFAYEDKYAGNYEGEYYPVTTTASTVSGTSCTKGSGTTVNDPVGPFAEEVTMAFRGPMNIYNIAVFDGSSGGDWTRVSAYDADAGTTDNLVFMNNLNVDYTGYGYCPQGFSAADALTSVDASTVFGGYLADASSPSTVGGGPGVSTGAEVNIMLPTSCDSDSDCKGYYDSRGYHGWDGGQKMFVTKVDMPTGSGVNLPAIWMLNAQIVRSGQYGCNCRNSGSVGGCGELDIAEVIETCTAQDKVSTHLYVLEGTYPSSGDNWADRPTDSSVTYVTIIDNSGDGVIKILQLGGDDFDFDASAVTADQVTAWLDASVSNLLT